MVCGSAVNYRLGSKELGAGPVRMVELLSFWGTSPLLELGADSSPSILQTVFQTSFRVQTFAT